MAITSNLVGPTGAQLDTASTAGLQAALQDYTKNKEESYKNAWQRVLDAATRQGKTLDELARDNPEFINTQFVGWGLKPPIEAKTMENLPKDAALQAKDVASRLLNGEMVTEDAGPTPISGVPVQLASIKSPTTAQAQSARVQEAQVATVPATPTFDPFLMGVIQELPPDMIKPNLNGTLNGPPNNSLRPTHYTITNPKTGVREEIPAKNRVEALTYLQNKMDSTPQFMTDVNEFLKSPAAAARSRSAQTVTPRNLNGATPEQSMLTPGVTAAVPGGPNASVRAGPATVQTPTQAVSSAPQSETKPGLREWLWQQQENGAPFTKQADYVKVSAPGTAGAWSDEKLAAESPGLVALWKAGTNGGSPATIGTTVSTKEEARANLATVDKGIVALRKIVKFSEGYKGNKDSEANKRSLYAANMLQKGFELGDNGVPQDFGMANAQLYATLPGIQRRKALAELQSEISKGNLDSAQAQYYKANAAKLAEKIAQVNPDFKAMLQTFDNSPDMATYKAAQLTIVEKHKNDSNKAAMFKELEASKAEFQTMSPIIKNAEAAALQFGALTVGNPVTVKDAFLFGDPGFIFGIGAKPGAQVQVLSTALSDMQGVGAAPIPGANLTAAEQFAANN